jgi:hypothetical protein
MGIQKSGDLAIVYKRDLAKSGYLKNKENEKNLGILFYYYMLVNRYNLVDN